MNYTAQEITETATRIKHDVNGNPRYYISAAMFRTVKLENGIHGFYRPAFCKKYTGKKFRAGWIFQSYSLANDIRDTLAASTKEAAQ